jgi:hypothetical protein
LIRHFHLRHDRPLRKREPQRSRGLAVALTRLFALEPGYRPFQT